MPSSSIGRRAVFLSIFLAGLTADLAVKSWIFGRLGMPGPKSEIFWLWPGVFGFQNSLNEGALFGLGQGFVFLFAVLSLAAAIGVLIWFFFGSAGKDWWLTVALGCVLVGIIGNLYDRLGLHGLKWTGLESGHQAGEAVYAVRDYILIVIAGWTWPNFNIADSLLVVGAALLFLHAFFEKEIPAAVLPIPENTLAEDAAVPGEKNGQ